MDKIYFQCEKYVVIFLEPSQLNKTEKLYFMHPKTRSFKLKREKEISIPYRDV